MSQGKVENVSLDAIVCAPQIRKQFDPESLNKLSRTIREIGIQQPLRVRRVGDRLILTDGERRWRAARIAGLSSVPVIIDDKPLSEADVVQRQLISCLQRADLNPIEKSDAINQLIVGPGWKASEVAERLGLSGPSVTRSLALLSLPEPIRKLVAKGEISASAAYELTRVEDSTLQSELASQLAKGEIVRDGLSGAVKRQKKNAGEPSTGTASRATAKLGAGRSVTVVADCLTLDIFIAALEELLGRARQARPKGLALATFLKVLRDQSNR